MVKRQRVTSEEILQAGNYGEIIKTYKQPVRGQIANVIYKEILPVDIAIIPYTLIDNLWLVSSKLDPKAPSWQGFMSKCSEGSFQTSTIIYDPMVPLNPSTWEAVYSTMVFVRKQADAVGQHCAILTFDQPLYYKAYSIQKEKPDEFQNMFVRLGGFHQLMSFLGAGKTNVHLYYQQDII